MEDKKKGLGHKGGQIFSFVLALCLGAILIAGTAAVIMYIFKPFV